MKAKTLFSFLLGCAVGAGAFWYGNSRRIMIVPSASSLVEVNHFTGEVRAVHVSQSDAESAIYADEDRIAALQKERERIHPPEKTIATAPASDEKPDPPPVPKTFKIEGQAGVVTYGVGLEHQSSRVNYRIHNGTEASLVRAQFRLEGRDPSSGVPVARTFWVDTKACVPASDVSGSEQVPGGGVLGGQTEVTKLDIIQIETKAP